MASAENAVFISTIIGLFATCFGAVYMVGDASGWHPMLDYQKWASSKTFYVGDIVRFEYNSIFHDVREVTERNYKSCNGTKAISTHYSGNDSFSMERPGHRYFICGFRDHCQHGQKVDIDVHDASSPSPKLSPRPSPGRAPTSSLPLPPSPTAHNPAPNDGSTESNVSSLHFSSLLIATKSLALIVLLFL
ncbi:hypothetical protein HRI_003800800 [Hibiscus trionum]|uniref:Phytocyanin domain-containing protein n=1 Tax=Hibiscus trionum TaxID=183268 RepID=A0A9W7MKW8_HIBTR|nr:hypothetical protein HRI_003800800 [Hibiscus trionum]